MPEMTIKYGDEEVPLLRRPWPRRKSMTPYFRTDLLAVGDNWKNAPIKGKFTENYVQLDGGTFPVGVLIARDLLDEGAIVAVCTDLTGGELRLLDTDLFCIALSDVLYEIIDRLRAANSGRLAGLPDAVALFPDKRIALREAKVAKKDRLSPNQHEFARNARLTLGKRLDLAVVEWGYEEAE
jgi:hypothetical protein